MLCFFSSFFFRFAVFSLYLWQFLNNLSQSTPDTEFINHFQKQNYNENFEEI